MGGQGSVAQCTKDYLEQTVHWVINVVPSGLWWNAGKFEISFYWTCIELKTMARQVIGFDIVDAQDELVIPTGENLVR